MESFWSHFGVTLGSLWGHFRCHFWGHFGVNLGSFRVDWGRFGGRFHVGLCSFGVGVILGSFWGSYWVHGVWYAMYLPDMRLDIHMRGDVTHIKGQMVHPDWRWSPKNQKRRHGSG